MSRESNNGITKELLNSLFEYDDGSLIWKSKGRNIPYGKVAGCSMDDGRRIVRIRGKTYLAHRLVFIWHYGEIEGLVDHIDHDPSNNRIENLRACNRRQNNLNAHRVRGSSKYRGVYKSRSGVYTAQLTINKKKHHIGSFKDEVQAAKAVDEYAKRVFSDLDGNFYIANFNG